MTSRRDGHTPHATEAIQHQRPLTGERPNEFFALVSAVPGRDGRRARVSNCELVTNQFSWPGKLSRAVLWTTLVEHDHRVPATVDRLSALEGRQRLPAGRIDDEVLVPKPVPEVSQVTTALKQGHEAARLQHPQHFLVDRLKPLPVAARIVGALFLARCKRGQFRTSGR